MSNSPYFSNERREMLDFIPDKNIKRVLEIGCSEGRFGAMLKNLYQCHVTGIELFTDAGNKAKDKLDQVYIADIEQFDFEVFEEAFDLIVANDVLEHLRDPWDMLQKLNRLLTTEGYFICSIPNIRYYRIIYNLLFKDEWSYVSAGILDKTHLRFFTKKTIIEAFENNGYTVEGIKGLSKPRKKWHIKNVQYRLFPDLLTEQYALVAKKHKQ